jgi:transposase
MDKIVIGVDVAVRAPHQASIADRAGVLLHRGYRFRTDPDQLQRLWSLLPDGPATADVTVVMEPTRNAWVPLAAWFRRRGATVVLVAPERSADLRAYYAKHTKSDRLDSVLLARLPLLHPDGLHAQVGLGPAEPLRRATKLRSTMVKRRTASLARLDALLELLGPGWAEALGGGLAATTSLRFLAAGYADPHVVRRLGATRLTRFIHRHSRGMWGAGVAGDLLSAARTTLALWDDELDCTSLAEDIAVEARLALALSAEIREVEERIAALVQEADPNQILPSIPGIGPVTGAVILGRLGSVDRFTSLAAIRSYTGLVPSLNASGVHGRHGGPTKRGDALLREALFAAADQARRHDPQLAAKYHRLMVDAGKSHTSATCHIATSLLNRFVACWRNQTPYRLSDPDGAPISKSAARALIAERYTVPPNIRRARATTTGWRHKRSPRAPDARPAANTVAPPERLDIP